MSEHPNAGEAPAVTRDSWPNTITDWLADNLADYPAPYQFSLIPAGGSNLTYIATAANQQRFVVRRPPLRARLASAHDMSREHRIMSALAATNVPVPEMLAYCSDESVCDVEFFCMAMVDGVVIRDRASSEHMSKADCERATDSLIDAQIAFHTVDLNAIGLGDMAQHDGYLERQLKRWQKQQRASATREVPLFDALHDKLAGSRPKSHATPGLAHGDYRFDNTILTHDYGMAAVLDWELCTIGDPVADFIWSLNYWAEPDDDIFWLLDPPTLNPNFPSRAEVFAEYQRRSGLDVENNLAWYQAFSWWKQACIVEGVYARMQKGAGGGMKTSSLDLVAERVLDYLAQATRYSAGI